MGTLRPGALGPRSLATATVALGLLFSSPSPSVVLKDHSGPPVRHLLKAGGITRWREHEGPGAGGAVAKDTPGRQGQGVGSVWGRARGAWRPGLPFRPQVAPRGRPGAHLRPRAGVPLEAGSLEARALLGGLLGQPALRAAASLRLPVGQLHAQDQPLLHPSATGGVTLSQGTDGAGSEARSQDTVHT